MICEGCIDAYLIVLSLRVLSDHMRRIFGGIGCLRVRTSFVSQWVCIESLYSPLALFRCECDFAQPWSYYSIRNRTWNSIDLRRLYRCLLNCAIASRAVWSHATNTWRYRTSARTHIFRLSACTYWLALQPAHTFPLWMRVCPAMIVLQHWKLHLEHDRFVKAASTLTCAIASRAVLLNFITYDENLAVSDVCAYPHHFVSQLVRIDFYYTACSRFSVVNRSLPSLDCITAFELHFEYDWFYRLYRCLLNCAIASRAVLLNLITW